MRTRKLGAAMLALAMLCSAVTGCGSSTGTLSPLCETLQNKFGELFGSRKQNWISENKVVALLIIGKQKTGTLLFRSF